MKLNDLNGAGSLSGCDFLLVREWQLDGEVKNTYRIGKSTFFQRTVHLIKYYVSGSYRKSVKEMRLDALRDLEKLAPVASARAYGTDGDGGAKDQIEYRLNILRKRGVNSRKFVMDVQSLRNFAQEAEATYTTGTVYSTSQRAGWTGKSSSSLSDGECQRYIKPSVGWEIKFVEQETRPQGSHPQAGSRPDQLCGHAALDCMTSALLADGVLQSHVDSNDSEITLDSCDNEAQSMVEKKERVSTAMDFLKFLTTEPHDETNEGMFKWSGFKDVGEADKGKFEATSFRGMEPPVLSGLLTGGTPRLKVLTPSIGLQFHVLNLLYKFPYEAGKGLAIDKGVLLTMSREAEEEGSVDAQQQKWVTDKLLKFLN